MIPGSGRPPGEGNGNPLQYSCLETPVDGEAWWATAYGVTKSWTRLSDFTSLYGPPEERKLPLPSYRTVRRMLPRQHSGKESSRQCRRRRRRGFEPCIGEIPREEEMATPSSILAWRVPWTEEPGRRTIVPWGCKESDVTAHTSHWSMSETINFYKTVSTRSNAIEFTC